MEKKSKSKGSSASGSEAVQRRESKFLVEHMELSRNFRKLSREFGQLVGRYEDEIPRLQVIASSLEEKVKMLSQSLESLMQRYESEVPRMGIDVQDVGKKLDETLQKFGTLETMWSDELARVRVSVDDLGGRLKDLLGRMEELRTALDVLRQQNAIVERKVIDEISEVESRLNGRINEIDHQSLRDGISQLGESLRKLREENEKRMAELSERIGDAVVESRREFENLKGEIEALKDSISSIREHVNSNIERIDENLQKLGGRRLIELMKELKEEIMYEMGDVFNQKLKELEESLRSEIGKVKEPHGDQG